LSYDPAEAVQVDWCEATIILSLYFGVRCMLHNRHIQGTPQILQGI